MQKVQIISVQNHFNKYWYMYKVTFFTSDDQLESGFALESSKVTDNELSNLSFIKFLKILVSGGKDNILDTTYVLPIVKKWQDVLLLYLKQVSTLFPEMNEVRAFVQKLKEGQYLAVSFNDTLDLMERKKLQFDMLEKEKGMPASSEYEKYYNSNNELFKIYRPLSYSYIKRIRFGTVNRKNRICRYCGKKIPETTFNHNSHTISNCLGNVNFFTNDECDKCNAIFGRTIEQEFLKYTSIYRTLSAQYEGHDYFKSKFDAFELSIDKESNKIDFKITDTSKTIVKTFDSRTEVKVDGGFVNFKDVYRALVKFVIGMLPDDELKYFETTVKWIRQEIEIKLPNIKQTIYKEPEQHPFINMFIRDNNSCSLPYLCAEFHVNHLEFVYAIPGCTLDQFNKNCIDEFLKLRKDSNVWRTIEIKDEQPTKMELTANFFLAPNKI